MSFSTNKPIERTYQEMKHFDREAFRSQLVLELSKIGSDYNYFYDNFNTVINEHAQ